MKENVRLWEDIILYCPLNQDVLLSTVHSIRTEKKTEDKLDLLRLFILTNRDS